MDEARKIGPGELVEDDSTREIHRRRAFARPGLWVGTATTRPGLTSGWHHHGDHDTVVYVLEGTVVIEFAEDGKTRLTAEAGDFLVIPPGLVHRESTPADGHSKTVVVRAGGDGPPTIEVEGPNG